MSGAFLTTGTCRKVFLSVIVLSITISIATTLDLQNWQSKGQTIMDRQRVELFHDPKADNDFVRLAAWFLGPKGENKEELKQLLNKILERHAEWRRTYYPQDPPYITKEIKGYKLYQEQLANIEHHVEKLSKKLRNSMPFFSSRYKGHMNWDISMPGLVGYFATMLFNPNNVAMEGSPVTTALEYKVGQSLCKMLGYTSEGNVLPWGHITCDGTVANIEAMWAYRNVKYQTVALQNALKKDSLPEFKDIEISVPWDTEKKQVLSLKTWELLNVDTDDILELLVNMNNTAKDKAKVTRALAEFDIQHIGMQSCPVGRVFVPASRHYSWDKAVAVLGIGLNNLAIVPLDDKGRMSVELLGQSLEECLTKEIPVSMVVVVVGSTAEGAVDSVSEVLQLRDSYKKRGLHFNVHADGAWGGYFCTMVPPSVYRLADVAQSNVPFLPLAPYVESQLRALKGCDSVTVDPHKSGFIQYPAGSLCYRNGAIRHLLSFSAPVISTGKDDRSIGIFGIEGSKPGAAVAATWLSHKVIGLNLRGYGRILGEANFSTKLIYCTLATMATVDDTFIIAPYNAILPTDVDFIRSNIIGKKNDEIRSNPGVMDKLRLIGPDLLINAFTLNFKTPLLLNEGSRQTNKDIKRVAKLLQLLAADLNVSGTSESEEVTGTGVLRRRLFLIRSTLGTSHSVVTTRLKTELGLDPSQDDLDYLVNTNMDPWPTATGFLDVFRIELRKSIIRCIGHLLDYEAAEAGANEGTHGFVATEASSTTAYGDHLPMFWMPEHQYHAIFKFRGVGEDAKKFAEVLQEAKTKGPLFFGNSGKRTLHQVSTTVFEADIFLGSLKEVPDYSGVKLQVVDILKIDHFDPAEKRGPKEKYFLYSNDAKEIAYMSHCITEFPDFQEVVKLAFMPSNMPIDLVDVGVEVTIVNPAPTSNGLVEGQEYHIKFISLNGEPATARIKVEKQIWFDNHMINKKEHN